MKKYNIPPGIALTLVFMLFALLVNAKGMDPQTSLNIQNRVESLTSSVSIKYNDRVKSKIWNLIHVNRKVSERMLGRSSIYFPLIEGVLKEKNLPQDLKYIAVIESGLNPHAMSRVRAMGLWQFMKPTAKWIGLSINRAVDERKDPIKSTYAAVDYLERLNKQFGDWTLALAAYNCGPGNVRKAIRKAGGSKDYWVIQKYLPRETRNYIPKIIAMNYVMNYYYDHDIYPEQVDENLKFTASVKVFDKVQLKDIAKQYNLDFKVVRDLNPSFLKNFIPESEGKHYLTLPESQLYDFVNKTESYDHMFHVNLLAANQAASYAEEKLNEPVNQTRLSSLEIKSIPSLGLRSEKAIDMRNPQRIRLVKLKRGQTMKDIATEYSISLKVLLKENNISYKNLPKQGDIIRVFQ